MTEQNSSRPFSSLSHTPFSLIALDLGGIEAMLGGPYDPSFEGDDSVWSSYRRTCPPDSPARRLYSSIRNVHHPSSSLHFAETTSGRTDFCRVPSARFTQGHFFSDYRTISALYPVFSPAKAPGYSDIRIPSHYYYGSTPRYTYGWDAVNLEMREVDRMEIPWERKLDVVFWRGASTGGGSRPGGWADRYQRHRWVCPIF
jgi:hypothetical protein